MLTVNGYKNACLLLIFIQEIRHLFNWLVMASVGAYRSEMVCT